MFNQPKTDNAKKFLSTNPTFLFRIHNNDYYEHPDSGDEASMVFITEDGKKKRSCFWDYESVLQNGKEY